MKKEKNNLFKFATKETSQDAFFSWIINWFNYKEESKYYKFSRDFLKSILPNGLINQINDISNIRIIRQFFNIDILLVLNMKDKTQNFLIIENKTISKLGQNQLNTILYYTKLVYELTNVRDKGRFDKFEIDTNVGNYENKVYCVLIKTGIKYRNNINDEEEIKDSLSKLSTNSEEYKYYKICKKYIKDNWKNHIKFMNTPNQLEELIKVLGKYKQIDNLIEDYHDTLLFNLTNESLINSNENSIEFISNTGILEENKTHFRTNYMCFECFKKLTNTDVENLNTQESTIYLNKLEIPNFNYNIVVDTLNFDKGNDFNNKFMPDGTWVEDQYKYPNIKYIYLFAKEINYFNNNSYYTFRGLFKLLEKDDNKKKWEKCNVSNDGKISIKKEDVESYIINEENKNN